MAGLPRLVATDLDGTLLRSDRSISARTRRALRSIVAGGVHLVVVTARPPRFVDRIADELDLTGEAICANGAIVYDLATRAWRATGAVPLPAARRVVDALGAIPGVGFAVETGDVLVHEPAFAKVDPGDLRLPVADLADMWHRGSPFVKLLAWSATHSADTLLAAAAGPAGTELACTHSGSPGLVEVSAAGVSKAAALAQLCIRLGVTADQVLAFGDGHNDLEMLLWAGAGIPVANAHPAVLAALPTRTAANNDDGVALALESIFGPQPVGVQARVRPGPSTSDPPAAGTG